MFRKLFILVIVIIVVLLLLIFVKNIKQKQFVSILYSATTTNTLTQSATPSFALVHGDYNFSLKVGSLTRKYILHVPESYNKNKETPLVLAFHGGMGTAKIMAENYDWIPKSDKEGFIVAFPNGVSKLPSGKFATWNAGNCCGYAVESNSDDVAFVKAIIEDIKKKVNVGKIFATGMSNGGMISYKLACEMSDTFTAIAGVSGTDNYNGCVPKKPISIMHIHGLKDDHVLFNGGCGPKCIAGSEANFVSVPNTISKWVDRNNCDKNPQTVPLNENAYYDLYANCNDGVKVKLIVVKDGGHSWPSTKKAPNPLEKSTSSQAISATDEIWDFFRNNLMIMGFSSSSSFASEPNSHNNEKIDLIGGNLFIVPTSAEIKIGRNANFKAFYQPLKLRSKSLVVAVWSSSNPNIATVSYRKALLANYKIAVVSGVSVGTTTVSATYKNTFFTIPVTVIKK